MVVEFMGVTFNGITPEVAKSKVGEVLLDLLEKTQLDQIHIREVIFAPLDQFEMAIKKHNPSEVFLPGTQAVGKAVPIFGTNPKELAVIIHKNLLLRLIDPTAPFKLKTSLSVISHEFGHCKDLIQRDSFTPPQDESFLRFEPQLDRRVGIWVEEFMADRNTSWLYTPEIFREEILEVQVQIRNILVYIHSEYQKVKNREIDPVLAAFTTMDCIWDIIRELQRLVAFCAGKFDLHLELKQTEIIEFDFKGLVIFLTSEYESLMSLYPNWKPEMFAFLKTVFGTGFIIT